MILNLFKTKDVAAAISFSLEVLMTQLYVHETRCNSRVTWIRQPTTTTATGSVLRTMVRLTDHTARLWTSLLPCETDEACVQRGWMVAQLHRESGSACGQNTSWFDLREGIRINRPLQRGEPIAEVNASGYKSSAAGRRDLVIGGLAAEQNSYGA